MAEWKGGGSLAVPANGIIIVNGKPKAFKGKHRGRKVKTQPVIVDTDESRRIDKASEAMAEVLQERIRKEDRIVAPATKERRMRAAREAAGFGEGAPATLARYRGKTPGAASFHRWLNDSGQLADSIVSKKDKKGRHPIKAKFAKRARYLGQLYKAIDLKTARKDPKVLKALEDGLRKSIVVKPLK